MPDLLPGYGWDRQSNRYRSGETGRFVSRDAITDLLDERIASAEARMGRLAAAYQAGEIAPAVWAAQMREEVKNLHLQNIALAKGGWDRLDQRDYGRVGAAVKPLYAQIAGSAADVQAGTVSLPQLQNRISNYAGSARRLYHQAAREGLATTAGMVMLERRRLDPGAQHCADCIEYAARGWQPAGTLPVPGEACQCRGNCRCSIEYREVSADEAATMIGEAATMPTANLQEARNCGEWFEARLHQAFTNMADEMFGEGYMSRDERIALSSAIGSALDAFRGKLESVAAGLYSRDIYTAPEPAAPDEMEMDEAGEIDGECIPLIEKAIRRDGTIPIKVIAPGWGSSGYYSPEVLQRDGPRVFTEGLHMYWDHQTATEEAERPEGELDDLAAVLVSAARWDASGPAGAGLYADAKVFPAYTESIDALAPHIGVSIRANGRAVVGEADGRRGPIIESITAAKSVDFVTVPGAGGQIISMFESARPRRAAQNREETDNVSAEKLQEAERQIAQLREALNAKSAAAQVAAALGGSGLPDRTQKRLTQQLAVNLPLTEAGELDAAAMATRIDAAITDAAEELKEAGAGGGKIAGMGGTATEQPAVDHTARLEESFTRLFGGDTNAAKVAAMGRR